MSFQSKIFFLLIFASFPFSSVDSWFLSDFFDDLWEKAKSWGIELLNEVNKELQSILPSDWECGPDSPKEIGPVSHAVTFTMVSTACSPHYDQINECCKEHDKCCNNYVPNTNNTEVYEPCDMYFCSCLSKAAGPDFICYGVITTFCLTMIIADNDSGYGKYLKHKERCEGEESVCLKAFESCLKDCTNENCANTYSKCLDQREECEYINLIGKTKNASEKDEKKRESDCCTVASARCDEKRNDCFSTCGNKLEDCVAADNKCLNENGCHWSITDVSRKNASHIFKEQQDIACEKCREKAQFCCDQQLICYNDCDEVREECDYVLHKCQEENLKNCGKKLDNTCRTSEMLKTANDECFDCADKAEKCCDAHEACYLGCGVKTQKECDDELNKCNAEIENRPKCINEPKYMCNPRRVEEYEYKNMTRCCEDKVKNCFNRHQA